ncbi:MAG TPA: hypothetical protein PKN33_03085 [Phycisphaerae bacterium]|nr:hypothetical protein [Phycisphaerae bacterium]
MTDGNKFLAAVAYLFCAAVIFPAAPGMAIIMVLALLAAAYMMIHNSE